MSTSTTAFADEELEQPTAPARPAAKKAATKPAEEAPVKKAPARKRA